jgi:hypothetical protein
MKPIVLKSIRIEVLNWLRQIETSAQSHFVILSGAKDLVFSRIYEILRSLRSIRMTSEGALAELSLGY